MSYIQFGSLLLLFISCQSLTPWGCKRCYWAPCGTNILRDWRTVGTELHYNLGKWMTYFGNWIAWYWVLVQLAGCHLVDYHPPSPLRLSIFLMSSHVFFFHLHLSSRRHLYSLNCFLCPHLLLPFSTFFPSPINILHGLIVAFFFSE